MNLRRALAGLWAIAPLALLLVTSPLLPAPERVPTLWTGRGPDAFTTGAGLTVAVLTVVVLCAIAAALVAVLQRVVPQSWSRWALTGAAALGWGAYLVYVVTVWRVGVDGPEQVGQGWPLLAVAGGLLAGWVAWAVHGRRVPTAAELAELVPERSRVQPIRGRGVRPVQPWSTEVDSRTMQVIAWGVLAVFAAGLVLVLVQGGSWVLALILAVTGVGTWVLAYAWSRVRFEVDAEGLRIVSRALPVRVSRVPAGEVAGADMQVLDAMRWGGIGLRPLPDRTSYMVDAGGPGIVVYQRDGRRLALQVTEGDQAARDGARTLLQAAGQRRGEEPTSS